VLNGHPNIDSVSAEETSPPNILRQTPAVAGFVLMFCVGLAICISQPIRIMLCLPDFLNMKAKLALSDIMKTLFSTFIALYSMGWLALADRATEGGAGFKNLRRKSTETSNSQKVRGFARNH
jgi:hypothetical protein